MANKGEVKLKVRQLALSLDEFTVKRLRGITGLNESSIRSEIDRLLQSGYVEVARTEAVKGKRGTPIKVYRAVTDPYKRTELVESVSAFLPPMEAAVSSRPKSPHYRIAVNIIDQELINVQRGGYPSTENLAKALEHLKIAAEDEALGEKGTEVIGIWIKREEARAEALAGEWEKVIQLKDQIQAVLHDVGMTSGECEFERVDECVYAGVISSRIAEAEKAMREWDYGQAAQATQEALDILQSLGSEAPSTSLAIRYVTLTHASLEASHQWKKMFEDRLSNAIEDRLGSLVEELAEALSPAVPTPGLSFDPQVALALMLAVESGSAFDVERIQ